MEESKPHEALGTASITVAKTPAAVVLPRAPAALGLQDFATLFRDPAMFESSQRWRSHGFVVDREGGKSDIMVAHHPAAPGYLFKRYSDAKVPLKDQLKNYKHRVEGADKLRAYIVAKRLTAIVVPRKHLLALPGISSHVLVVERIAILDAEESKQRYRQLSADALKQLCRVIVKFSGLDSGARNLPITRDGKIAFIDTERWDEKKDHYLKHVREHLSKEQRKVVKKALGDRW